MSKQVKRKVHVYVLLRCSDKETQENIVGIYLQRDAATLRKSKLEQEETSTGKVPYYYAVLKKSILGAIGV